MISRIEVSTKEQFIDPRASSLLSAIEANNIDTVTDVKIVDVYIVECKRDDGLLESLSKNLFTDHVKQDYRIDEHFYSSSDGALFEIGRKTGVMDPVVNSIYKAIRNLDLKVEQVRRGTQYLLMGSISPTHLDTIKTKLLSNPAIDEVIDGYMPTQFPEAKAYVFNMQKIELLDMTEDQLVELSKTRRLALNSVEMLSIQDYFKQMERNPTDIEIETLAQTWSEHCKHKTLCGTIQYDGRTIVNLLKSTIKRATEELDKDWCISVFSDNSGVIDFDGENAICVKVETHNHPSAIEPYGGAGTGIGGVIRDILGTGLGAKPIMNTDVFCFAAPDYPEEDLPKGTIHPKRLMQGVVSGVRDYGNRMGIPTANGAICFDDRYVGNPLVYCGTVGVMPSSAAFGVVAPGDHIVAIGGRTGRDGIGGATFSSIELDEDSEVLSSGAVQIGNAIQEKKVLDVILKARDAQLYRGMTDCGAGGFSSAVGEMGEHTGARVDLEKAPLKYDGLSYTEIWISEAQERMVLSVQPENLQAFTDLCATEDVEAVVLGEFTDSKKLELFYDGHQVADLDMDFMHNGLPIYQRTATWTQTATEEPSDLPTQDDCTSIAKILADYNVCSKESVIRQYDHEVQGTSVIKPLQGLHADGPGDAAVVTPILGNDHAVVVGSGIQPSFGDIDPYHMAMSVIDEALRNCVATGGNPDHTAILDNFSWGNADKPETLGAMVRACDGCYDAAVVFGTPFISGKDSLNNEYKTDNGTIAIPHTLLITAVSVIKDYKQTCTMDLKHNDSSMYILGTTKNELGGSRYYAMHDQLGANVPTVDPTTSLRTMRALHQAIKAGLVSACHDLSDGGLGVAAAEMAFAGGFGMEINLAAVPCDGDLSAEQRLFSESNSRFLVEVKHSCEAEFVGLMKDIVHAKIGESNNSDQLSILGMAEELRSKESIWTLKAAWQSALGS